MLRKWGAMRAQPSLTMGSDVYRPRCVWQNNYSSYLYFFLNRQKFDLLKKGYYFLFFAILKKKFSYWCVVWIIWIYLCFFYMIMTYHNNVLKEWALACYWHPCKARYRLKNKADRSQAMLVQQSFPLCLCFLTRWLPLPEHADSFSQPLPARADLSLTYKLAPKTQFVHK